MHVVSDILGCVSSTILSSGTQSSRQRVREGTNMSPGYSYAEIFF